eukprot:CAMPEP_0201592652 /NCGR_PEP_ID=MMETSP0190_2-20130828/190490_1 /ASSEMBLY_ACC=CAM_ASM_000263 /TAXON_ID=37353 /ORGANISM="Rosalina sp." /LENGTH=263 /DNA_ID=CAMNT_0048051521 /DNA_START=19 /DNA_END=807 /DNA_ORIENTATION=+
MEPVDYGDTSEDETQEINNKSSNTNTNDSNNLVSLMGILQSHQKVIDAESASSSTRKRKKESKSSSSSSSRKSKKSKSSSSGSSSSSSSSKVKPEQTQLADLNNLDLSSILAPTINSLMASTNTSAANNNDHHNHSHESTMNIDNNNNGNTAHNPPPVLPIETHHPNETVAYFILRSNNEENVRTSMEKGVWATQPQNEPILNEAYEKFDKVILFFSVCRSMHFQGVSQMTSRIGHHKSKSLWENEPHARGKGKWGGTFNVIW